MWSHARLEEARTNNPTCLMHSSEEINSLMTTFSQLHTEIEFLATPPWDHEATSETCLPSSSRNSNRPISLTIASSSQQLASKITKNLSILSAKRCTLLNWEIKSQKGRQLNMSEEKFEVLLTLLSPMLPLPSKEPTTQMLGLFLSPTKS